MSWAEVKKINDNMGLSLDKLFLQFLSGGYREYIYETRNYIVPFDGTFTIRAFCGKYGSYGKVVKKCVKGEVLTITITDNTALSITSDKETNASFNISLTKDSIVNANSSNGFRAMAIGGANFNSDGGNAYVRANNGIASGGGGSGGTSQGANGFNGGRAYAYGTNTYALGGGGGGGGDRANSSSSYGVGGLGGNAYINGSEITSFCSTVSLISGKGNNGENGRYTSSYKYGGFGGNGGCGGGAGANRLYVNTSTTPWYVGGFGYFSDGGCCEGGSARGGNVDTSMDYEKNATNQAKSSGAFRLKGYFAGGTINSCISGGNFPNGGTGGFIGGRGANFTGNHEAAGNGGYSPYGIGGKGGSLHIRYGNNAGNGGDGKIFGGDGGDIIGRVSGYSGTTGNGGNGYYAGRNGADVVGTGGGDVYYGSNGYSITNNMIIGTAPIREMTQDTSIVIIEYGDSPEDF